MDRDSAPPRRLLLRVDEVAAILGVGRAKAYALVGEGQLPSLRLGGSLRVPAAALERWVEEHAQPGQPPQRDTTTARETTTA